MVLHDRLINEWSLNYNMITPYKSFQVKESQTGKQISHGLSSYGYDASCSREFKLFTNTNSVVVDPKKFDDTACIDIETDVLIMPPHSFALTRTVEYFKIPASMIAICVGKSTYARCGIIVNVTPLEPEWEGHVTIELTNSTPLPCKIYANEGICQFLFLQGTSFCDVTYKQRHGKYQGQQGITVARC